MPTISKSRDHGELQDMYRRALAASWASTGTELPADQCVEDIFNGGDGWKDKRHPRSHGIHHSHEDSLSDERPRLIHHHHAPHHRTPSGSSLKSQSTITDKRAMRTGQRAPNQRDVSGRSKPEPQQETSSGNSSEAGRGRSRQDHEVDEFEARDNLSAWKSFSILS